MPVKTFRTRIKNKIDTKVQLNNMVPLKGEIVIGGDQNNQAQISTNTNNTPYIAKIGDGETTWQNLPSLGNIIIDGHIGTLQNLGGGNALVNVTIPSGNKRYEIVDVNSSANVQNISLHLSGSSPLLSDHYVLIKNNGTSDLIFTGLTATFEAQVSNSNIYTRQDYITPGDICEVQIKIFKINGSYYISAVPQLGIMQTIHTQDGEYIWNVNRY